MTRLMTATIALSLTGCFFDYKAPRTPHGDPDLQGVWTNGYITTLEKPKNARGIVTTHRNAAPLERRYNQVRAADSIKALKRRQDLDKSGKRAKHGLLGYNLTWRDPGTRYAEIDDKVLLSWIYDPPTGKIPYTEKSKALLDGIRFDYSNPETMPIWERCLLGFGSPAGPPMLNQSYNNTYQIVQSPGYVAILVEMVHDVRIIRLNEKPLPANMRPWMGDSIGRWDGDTLEVVTRNINPQQKFWTGKGTYYYMSPNSIVTEKFTRVAENRLMYHFTVEEKEAYTQAWSARIPMRPANTPVIFEYACHEGNKSMANQMAGAKARPGSYRGSYTAEPEEDELEHDQEQVEEK